MEFPIWIDYTPGKSVAGKKGKVMSKAARRAAEAVVNKNTVKDFEEEEEEDEDDYSNIDDIDDYDEE